MQAVNAHQRTLRFPVGILLTFSINLVQAEELVVGCAGNRPPYCFQENGEFRGIEIKLIREILASSGHTIRVVDIPKNRLVTALQQSEIDIAATVQGTSDASVFYSQNYLDFHNVVISKARHQIQIKQVSDLRQYSLVSWQGAWKNLGSDFEKSFGPDQQGNFPKKYFQAFNQLNQNRMFWADRAQLIVIDKQIFEYHRKLLKNEFDTTEALDYHDIFKARTSYQVAFRKANLQRDFDEGLKKFKQNGSYLSLISTD